MKAGDGQGLVEGVGMTGNLEGQIGSGVPGRAGKGGSEGFSHVGLERVQGGVGPEAHRGLAAVGVAVQGHQAGQGEGGQEGRDQEADDALTEDHDVFADEGFAVQDQGDRGLEVRQEHRVLRGQAGRHRQEFVRRGEEGRFVGVKREDQGPLPVGGDVPAQLRHPAHRGIAVFEGEGQGAGQRRDAGVRGQVPGGLAPVNQSSVPGLMADSKVRTSTWPGPGGDRDSSLRLISRGPVK